MVPYLGGQSTFTSYYGAGSPGGLCRCLQGPSVRASTDVTGGLQKHCFSREMVLPRP